MPSLTRAEAAERTALLFVRDYRVDLDLTVGPDTFRSVTTIRFTAATPGAGTFLDVRPAALHSVTLNGRPLADPAVVDGRLPLPDLAADNELVVVADMAYSRECQGLHRYVDPADGQVYVYAFVYIDNAPLVFACFDQPDLKAPYEFTVTTEDDWSVLGTTEATREADGRWRLAPSPPQATYLTTVVAGPYASFHTDHGGVRLGLHCRASLAAALEQDLAEVFEVTGQCLDEFDRMFGVGYPFGKFDQVFVPEFAVLSLDHPGCVLLRELYLFSAATTASERETRAVVIAHGLSLMWLAGLVTNRWWNDLWLGQAFADYMAHRVTSEVTRFRGPLTTFSARRKGQAYLADQRPSTHPVALEGPDVQSVLLDLDRISYFKGSSVLRQLATRLGTEALRAGLRVYFGRHAYGTATFADFLAAMREGTGTDLTDWATVWLERANVTTLTPEVEVADGRIVRAVVRQTAPDSHPVLRPHVLQVGLHGEGGSPSVRVTVDGEATELPELAGRPVPELLLLNEDDLTYAKVRFDDRARAALPRLLPGLSPINRAMVWCNLLLGVQDGVVTAGEHLALVAGMVGVEPELSILTEVLEQARQEVADRFLDPAARPAAMAAVAAALRDRLARTAAGDERQLTLFRALVEFTADPGELRGWLGGSGLPAGLTLDADLAWRVRYRLAVLGDLSEPEIAAAYAAGPDSRGEEFTARCRAARPDPEVKAAAWAAITTDPTLSNYQVWALAEGFWQPEQADLTEPYVERFFADVPAAARLRGDLALSGLVAFLFPRHAAEQGTLDAARSLLDRADIPVPLRRKVVDLTDDLRRVVAVRSAGVVPIR